MLTKQMGFTLIETLVSAVIGVMLCILCLHLLFSIMPTYYKIQHKFKVINRKLVASHYIRRDILDSQGIATCSAKDEDCSHLVSNDILSLISNGSIKPHTNVLVIYNLYGKIVYYLRKSAIPNTSVEFRTKSNTSTTQHYALYKDDIIHNAQALIEEIVDFQVQFIAVDTATYKILIKLVFTDAPTLEIICVLANHN